ncbi:MAG: ATP-binding protein [Gammaproteobacteria bacterium]|nr:ATP-binding protein [Gammaproteobacteria bacterium]
MDILVWADEQLSKDLPVLRACGENQDLEYMESFPQNVRELAKEIAAFATSNAGTILIGVSNTGDLIGLEGTSSPDGRDGFLRRVEGICRGTIKPAITPIAKFAVESDKIILVLTIPKGNQPIYYSNNIPYVRHITESRPAEPHEVIDLIRSYLATFVQTDEGERTETRDVLSSELAQILTNVLIYTDEVSERNVNPWLEIWRTEFRYAASELRQLATQDVGIQEAPDQDLSQLADALDKVATFRLYLGCGPELSRLMEQAADLARTLKKNRIDPVPLSEQSLHQIKSVLISSSTKLQDLVSRADAMINSGRVEELQTEASNIGLNLLRASFYNIEPIAPRIRDDLHSVARELHLVETMRLYMDGGASLRSIIDRVSQCNNRLEELARQISD